MIGLKRRAERRRDRARDDRVVHLVAARCLDYPLDDLVESLPMLTEALAEQADSPGARELRPLVDHLGSRPLEDLQRAYVDTFDLSRKHALYLSYWTDGDTRRRGEVLGRFKAAYRRSGFLVDTHGELPDYLPMVLEFAACADADAGAALLQDYRASLELLRIALQEKESPYAAAAVAVCATLPGPSPVDRAAVMEMVGMSGPQPTESVGLDPYDPRLLPLQSIPRAAVEVSS
ncbi:nitrate reductase molybdenum cofactor assembly chaperone [Humibacillus xanthopallidus]|uniref:Respiratory nitrate reductase chaperone NarJ n=1 Tax=Humibacillus xanthopallidus TaxID=412689 RepID=A0A543HA72_9MICO|nr:nitrate reductase molybdenum cofactor assembly chaperone [Humibacillus xanthopallidus]TQM55228.1 respiratory nitrate reductase chaperone NarJ [Humibacillus xanthopallidus]